MHKETFDENLQENSVNLEKDFCLKENVNKGYSFPRYLKKYEGFAPDLDIVDNSLEINGEDIRRIFKINDEYVHSYFMEYQRQHFSPLRLCNNNVIERICEYFENDSKSYNSSDKENCKNIISEPSSEVISSCDENLEKNKVKDEILDDCHMKLLKDNKSQFLKKAENKVYFHVDSKFKINIEDIQNEKDKRTTCMIKNIPNKYTQKMLIDLLNEHHFGCYDFVYLRMDFKNKCNVGYAFVNLIDPLCIVSFYTKINQKGWKRFSSNKIAQLTYASIQGLDNLKKKFRKSSVMQEQESYRPKLFYSDGPLKGYECTEF